MGQDLRSWASHQATGATTPTCAFLVASGEHCKRRSYKRRSGFQPDTPGLDAPAKLVRLKPDLRTQGTAQANKEHVGDRCPWLRLVIKHPHDSRAAECLGLPRSGLSRSGLAQLGPRRPVEDKASRLETTGRTIASTWTPVHHRRWHKINPFFIKKLGPKPMR